MTQVRAPIARRPTSTWLRVMEALPLLAVLLTVAWLCWSLPPIRASVFAGPMLAAAAGASAWLLARCFSGPALAANDNAPRLAPAASRR